jgi:hypothetical protein
MANEPIFAEEYITFDMYFASLVAMQVHPGAGAKGNKPLTLEECRDKAIEMLRLRRQLPVYRKTETVNRKN